MKEKKEERKENSLTWKTMLFQVVLLSSLFALLIIFGPNPNISYEKDLSSAIQKEKLKLSLFIDELQRDMDVLIDENKKLRQELAKNQ